MSQADLDGDGKLSEKELLMHQRRVSTQRNLSITAMISMVLFTAMLMTPLIPETRVDSLSDIFSMFYIIMGGIIAAFFGVSGWMSKK
jgi:hypothetical protein